MSGEPQCTSPDCPWDNDPDYCAECIERGHLVQPDLLEERLKDADNLLDDPAIRLEKLVSKYRREEAMLSPEERQKRTDKLLDELGF